VQGQPVLGEDLNPSESRWSASVPMTAYFSFTSFPPTPRVQFAQRADIWPMPAFTTYKPGAFASVTVRPVGDQQGVSASIGST
jgi:hypothetical protein